MKLAEFLEREGGHIFLLAVLAIVFLLVVVLVSDQSNAAKLAESGFGVAIGALGYAMKGNGNKKDERPTSNGDGPEKPQSGPQ